MRIGVCIKKFTPLPEVGPSLRVKRQVVVTATPHFSYRLDDRTLVQSCTTTYLLAPQAAFGWERDDSMKINCVTDVRESVYCCLTHADERNSKLILQD